MPPSSDLSRIWTVPNVLSLARLVLAIAVFVLIVRRIDVAATILQPKLSQVGGVGQVVVSGGASPAVRVSVNPLVLERYGLGLDDVRAALQAANANRPKGTIDDGAVTWSIATTE